MLCYSDLRTLTVLAVCPGVINLDSHSPGLAIMMLWFFYDYTDQRMLFQLAQSFAHSRPGSICDPDDSQPCQPRNQKPRKRARARRLTVAREKDRGFSV